LPGDALVGGIQMRKFPKQFRGGAHPGFVQGKQQRARGTRWKP